jgi:hypothetical protein
MGFDYLWDLRTGQRQPNSRVNIQILTIVQTVKFGGVVIRDGAPWRLEIANCSRNVFSRLAVSDCLSRLRDEI